MLGVYFSMSGDQVQLLNKLTGESEELTFSWIDYWLKYSNLDTWQFWINILFLIIPLIVLFFYIDRKKIFHIGFFGLNLHIWFTYIDTFGAKLGFWSYPYQTIPLVTANFGLDVSFMPVLYMLIYQYTVNQNKNYYLYTILAAFFFTYTLKPIFVALNLLQLHKGIGYFHLALVLIPVLLLSKWITNLFLYLEENQKVIPTSKRN
jgi:hypothetical protein